ncbi:MAG: fatty acid desaturase CarF family protein [Gemmatimonas sp.]|uniref:fatty acid desaturase CarF family protein n=1 Tax=Gemmatimonas sp. TaxID=1962908 RepID=UPI00391FB0AD|nr:fatty acid desaturase family protein [Gemmatimonadota bacterium]
MSVLFIVAQVVAVWLVTDFLSGLFHWIEDAYGDPSWPIVGRHVTKPNILHHYAPRAFVTNSWFLSSRLLLAICATITVITLAFGVFNWMIALSMVLGLNANQVHKWSHRSRRENGPIVGLLQRLHLIQSPSHHHRHHVQGKDSHYCVLTDFLNPVLDGLGFWRGLERGIARVFGVQRRDDQTMAEMVLVRDPGIFGPHLEAVRQQVERQARVRTQAQPQECKTAPDMVRGGAFDAEAQRP